MYEQCQKDGNSKFRVCVVGGIGDETFWEFMEGDCYRRLETDGEERIFGDMMMMVFLMLMLEIV